MRLIYPVMSSATTFYYLTINKEIYSDSLKLKVILFFLIKIMDKSYVICHSNMH